MTSKQEKPQISNNLPRKHKTSSQIPPKEIQKKTTLESAPARGTGTAHLIWGDAVEEEEEEVEGSVDRKGKQKKRASAPSGHARGGLGAEQQWWPTRHQSSTATAPLQSVC
ncbi:hypothetical protein NL676_026558 [Syzygium grande]|nr:hypothetical protein NL676_026558 [Syzygium grande]